MTIRLRFAPSPTGRIHVGNVRTALMNWLFAIREGGQVLLRIDDTDTARSTQAFEQSIVDDLAWLGLKWSERANQSHRFDVYEKAAEKLKAAGLLYPCYETEDELDRKRKIAQATGKKLARWVVPWIVFRTMVYLVKPFSELAYDLMQMFLFFRTGKFVSNTASQERFFGPAPTASDAVTRWAADKGLR